MHGENLWLIRRCYIASKIVLITLLFVTAALSGGWCNSHAIRTVGG